MFKIRFVKKGASLVEIALRTMLMPLSETIISLETISIGDFLGMPTDKQTEANLLILPMHFTKLWDNTGRRIQKVVQDKVATLLY